MAWTRQKTDARNPDPAGGREARATVSRDPWAQDAAPDRGGRNEALVVHIGKSVRIEGDVTADEDLNIEGTVNGKVLLKDHVLHIGVNGHINNEIHAKSVIVSGDVSGDMTAEDKIEITSTGSVKGNISAARVVLADGCRFKGNIDMGSDAAGKASARTAAAAAPHAPAPEIPRSASASEA